MPIGQGIDLHYKVQRRFTERVRYYEAATNSNGAALKYLVIADYPPMDLFDTYVLFNIHFNEGFWPSVRQKESIHCH